MYMLMMMLFGSLTLPLAVLMSLPLALVGAFGAMALTRTPFTLFSLLGVRGAASGWSARTRSCWSTAPTILRRAGLRPHARRCSRRARRGLRPIIMTTVSVMAALLPIASGLEEGSELLQSRRRSC